MALSGPPNPTPFVGPRPFETGERLFGRSREARDLTDLLIAERLVLFYSPSGAGKTSLIQAELIGRLTAARFAVSPILRMGQPSAEPGENRYLTRLTALLAGNQPAPLADLPGLCRALQAQSPTGKAVLLFDQFEEILTSDAGDVAGKETFFATLGQLLRDRALWALFAMREEFVAMLDPYRRHLPTRLSTNYRLELLEQPAAVEAVLGPANGAITRAAAVQLCANLSLVRTRQPDGTVTTAVGRFVEPVQLQVVADRLWRDNQPTPETPLGAALVSDVAEVDEALESYYDERLGSNVAMTAASASGAGVVSERRVREWFDRSLITSNGLRTQVIAEQSEDGEQVAGLPLALVRLLVDAHLVREENRRGLLWYELAHDRLIEPVRRANERWRQAHLSRLQQQAALWLTAGRDRSLLLRGAALTQALAPAGEGDDELNVDEQVFLQESLAAEQAVQAEARQARRIRNLGYGMAVAGVLALVVAAVAIWQWRVAAAAEARVAEQARLGFSWKWSVQSELVVEQSSLSALLAVTAAEVADTAAARSALLKTLQANAHVRTILRSVAPPIMEAGQEGLDPATDLFTRIVGLVALDNGAVVSARADGLIELWDANRGQLLASPFLPSVGKRLAAMAANDDGSRLFLGFVDGTVSWWDLQPPPEESPRFVQVGKEDAGGGEIFQLLPVGEGLLVVTEQGVRRLPSLAATPFDGQLSELPAEAWSLALDPVAPMLFVGYTSGEVAVLRPDQPHQLLPTQRAEAVYALAWHPESQQLAVGDWSGNLTLWFLGDVDNPSSFSDGNVSQHSLRHLAYAPSGALWVLDEGGNAQFVRQEDGAVLLEGNVLDRVRSATGFTASAVRPEENLLFAGTMSGEIYVLATTNEPYFVEALPAEIDFGLVTAFAPAGDQVAVTSQFSPVQWGPRLPEGQAAPLRPLTWPAAEGFAPQDTALAFAPASSDPPVASDGQEHPNLAVGTWDGRIRLYGVWPGDEPLLEFEHVPGSYLNTLDFSPDGRYLLAGSTGGEIDGVVISRTLQLYQLEGPFARWSVAGVNGLSILDTLWAADQRRFYAVAEDGLVAGWDLPQEPVGEVAGPAVSQFIVGALSLARSPTAGELLVGAGEGWIYRWHPASGVIQSGSLPGPNAVAQLAYDDATGYIATQSTGNWVQLWDATLEQPLGGQFGYNVMAFGGDKELLTDSLFDGNLWIWPLDMCRLQATACRAANRTLTPAEMRQYNVPEAYSDVCAAVLQRCTPSQMAP